MTLLSGVILGVFLCNLTRWLWRSWKLGEGVLIHVETTGPYKTVIVRWPAGRKAKQ
jgi:hypothetical protein